MMRAFFSRGEQTTPADDRSVVDTYTTGPRAPERPPLPRPEGLNRNALTIAAVIMGTIVLAAVVFVQPSRPVATATSRQATPSLDQGTFLDQPPAQPISPTPSNSATDRETTDSTRRLAMQQRADSTVAIGRPPVFDSPYSQPVPLARDDVRDAHLEGYLAALVAPVRAATSELTDSDRSETAAVGAPAIESHTPGATRPIGQLSARATRDQASSTPVSPTSEATSETRVSVDSASSPYVVQAGTLVPAVLITEINSDLPGQVLAPVARDVYDTRSQRTILIPRGAKLIGTYEDQVPVGRDRLLVAWTRVLFPDGRSISLPGLQTKDRAGAGGVSDRVDRHVRRTFGTTALLSLIGAGLQLSQARGAMAGGAYYPSAGQIAAGAVGQQLAEVGAQLLKRDIDARPTIRIRQGLAFNVFLNTDLVFQQPHDPSP